MKLNPTLSVALISAGIGVTATIALILWLAPLRQGLLATGPAESGAQQPATSPPAVTSYADAVANTAPAVVNIFAVKLTREKRSPLAEDPVFQRFFDDTQTPRIKRENSLGSGVIVDNNGYILTNNHVIEGAAQVSVMLGDGRQIPARVVGSDPDTDLAILQAGGDLDLPLAQLGGSERLRVGDVVLAIGNPFAVGQTVTMGIVSAIGRKQLGITNFEDFIQTDAAINPGNSGGALINSAGEVVGINTAIFSESGGSHGIGFAIPEDLARDVMRQIIAQGRVIRGWLGITGQGLTPQLVESLGLHNGVGILVSGVLRDGPADRAGMAVGDVILAIEGEPVETSTQLLNRIAAHRPGSNIRIKVIREGKPLHLRAQVVERPTEVTK